MLDRRSVYDPGCIVCGPVARCDCPWLEGCLVGIERVSSGSRGHEPGLVVHLATARGRHVLFLDGQFAYLADGLAQAPEGVVLRAYHLRLAGQSQARPGVQSTAAAPLHALLPALTAWLLSSQIGWST